jgi:beta-galactosidase
MLDHQARKTTIYAETAQVFGELARLAEMIDATQFVATVAMLHSEDMGWAWNKVVSTRLRPLLESVDISTQGRMLRWYQAFYHEKVSLDMLDPLRDLSKYSVVVAPNLYLITPEIAAHLERYVQQGGWLIVGPKAALKNWNNVFLTDVPPGCGLDKVFGATVKRAPFRMGFGALPQMTVSMQRGAPLSPRKSFVNEGVFDYLEATTATSIACFANGETAITVNRYGEGLAMYLGCEPEEAFYRELIGWLAGEGRVAPVLRTDADVEATLRSGGGHDLIFVLNHNQETERVELEGAYHEWISGQTVSGTLAIEGQGVRILERVG